LIPAGLVIVSLLVAAGGCIFYAYTRGLRQKRAAWGWMAAPVLLHAAVYFWIAFWNPSPEARVFPVRWSTLIEHAFLAYLTIYLGIVSYRDHGQ